MDIIRKDVVLVDPAAGLHKDEGLRTLCYEDKAQETIGIALSAAPTGTAAVRGYFVRADGATVELTGTVSGTEYTVTLSESCCAVPGAFTLAIQLRIGDTWRTLRYMEGVVLMSRTDSIVETDEVIADLEALRAAVALAIVAPAGGTAGQILTKTATGYAWGDAPSAPSRLTIGGVSYDIVESDTPAAGTISITYEEE